MNCTQRWKGSRTLLLSLSPVFLLAAWTAAACPALGDDSVDPGVGDVYPLTYCVLVPDIDLDDGSKILVIEGRELRVCCGDCESQVLNDSYSVLEQIDEQVVKQQSPIYPLKTCIVDDKPLGESALDAPFRNRLFRVCSSACEAEIKRKPAEYFGKLDFAVIDQQQAGYPLDRCVVSGKPLGEGGIDHVVANRLVRLSGYDQLEAFNKFPGKFLRIIQEASDKPARQ